MNPSHEAAQALFLAAGRTADLIDIEDLEGATDCPDGCEVEPDGICPHGWLSAARTLGVI